MSGKVRAEAPARLLELMAARGGSPERVLAAAGISAADLADLDRPIEIETVMRLVDAAAHEMGDDCFGLHGGSLIDFGVLGMLAYAVLNAPTVGTALRNFERYARSHFRGPRISLEIEGHEAQLSLVLDPGSLQDGHHQHRVGVGGEDQHRQPFQGHGVVPGDPREVGSKREEEALDPELLHPGADTGQALPARRPHVASARHRPTAEPAASRAW